MQVGPRASAQFGAHLHKDLPNDGRSAEGLTAESTDIDYIEFGLQ
ncbi:hypothetical protein QF030_000065 [Streptomyces rishiriensis]|uniref:Uncharacterized protein n=1 Tax=Streptomyces rishiriensis TaxID=68264 RepID=A0ABU0NGX2_STRRH|nr:hypothetical protein [Streptomyces rishiriensis]